MVLSKSHDVYSSMGNEKDQADEVNSTASINENSIESHKYGSQKLGSSAEKKANSGSKMVSLDLNFFHDMYDSSSIEKKDGN